MYPAVSGAHENMSYMLRVGRYKLKHVTLAGTSRATQQVYPRTLNVRGLSMVRALRLFHSLYHERSSRRIIHNIAHTTHENQYLAIQPTSIPSIIPHPSSISHLPSSRKRPSNLHPRPNLTTRTSILNTTPTIQSIVRVDRCALFPS